MKKIEELDKLYMFWNRANHMVEAYNVFYGEYPTFSNFKEKKI